MVGALPYIKEE